MSDSNPNRLAASASEIDSPDERRQFLDQACGDDSSLREQVERLIQEQHDAGLLESNDQEPGLSETVSSPASENTAGAVIGPYKLLQQIGEGGMGSVWMAEQEQPVRRMVALKIIKAGMDSKQVIARFEAERQALAMMSHPNIAKVLDAGTTKRGRPYFVMELVKGLPITEFCDKQKSSPQERLKLFVDVCRAVGHAHGRGVLHRDIKPSNVMVTLHDGVPVVKVIDFGLAKAMNQKLTEKTLFTEYGQMVGTPAYMSPEQAEFSGLEIDRRTDVYSLGVLLYELMTGTTPISSESLREAGFAEIQRLIREQDAPPMSTRLSSLGGSSTVIAERRSLATEQLSKFFKGDLDVIVLKSLDKDRQRRYATPADFADDVVRFLNDEAIQARPDSSAYRLKKYYHRHRVGVITAFSLAAVLLVAGSVGGVMAIRASRAERLASERGKELTEQRRQQALALEQAKAIEEERLRLEKQLQDDPENEAVATLLADLLVEEYAAQHSPAWKVLEPIECRSLEGSELRILEDDSVLAGGNLPDYDTYEFVASSPVDQIRAIRLEALPDSSLPMGRSGRMISGNFALTEVELNVEKQNGKSRRTMIADSVATDSYRNRGSLGTIDGQRRFGPWSVEQRGVAQAVYYRVASDSDASRDSRLIFRLFSGHVSALGGLLGKFRIAVSDRQDDFDVAALRNPDGYELDPWQRIAVVHYLNGNHDRWKKLVESHPALIATIGNLAFQRRDQDVMSYSKERLSKILGPKELAEWSEGVGDWTSAVGAYSELLASNPDDSALLTKRANAHRAAGDYDQAAVDYGRALDLLKSDRSPYYGPEKPLAIRLAGMPEISEVLKKQRPDDASLIVGRTRHYAQVGRWELVEPLIEKHNTGHVWKLIHLSLVKPLLGKNDEYVHTRKQLVAVLKQDSGLSLPWTERALRVSLLHEDGAEDLDSLRVISDRAFELLESADLDDRYVAWFYLTRSLLEYRDGEFETAIGFLEEYQSRFGHDARGWVIDRRAGKMIEVIIQYKLGNKDEATQAYQQAMQHWVFSFPWRDSASADLIRMEAEKLLNSE